LVIIAGINEFAVTTNNTTMKKQTKFTILIFLLSILIYDGAIGQTNECKSVKIGKFEIITPTYGKTIITRTKANQTEVNDSLKYEATFDLIWIDNCTYELRNKKLVKGNIILSGQPTDILKVEIQKIENDKIYIKSSSNYSERVVESVLTKIELK
jgi:hypothetical protein